tara:strand:+ start:82 stop:1197 length:1116 start_codon:yes stop_codon:yes gene_type:complete
MNELDLLVENYFTNSFETSELFRLVEEFMNAPDQGRKRNIELAMDAANAEGLEYELRGKNKIIVKNDDRLEVMRKLASTLEPLGFVYNPDMESTIGRIEIHDKQFGSAYILVKPKSRIGAATKGYDYEDKLRDNINQRYGDEGYKAESAGPGHGSDLTIEGPGLSTPLKIEVKTSLGADFGQFRVQYNPQTDSWEPRKTKGYIKSEKIFQPLFDKYLKDQMNQSYRLPDLNDPRLRKDKNNKIAGLARSRTTGEFKRQIQSSWFDGKTDYKVAFPFEEISSYYVAKGDKYIQLGTKGLFALDDEAASLLGIPKFSDSGITSFLRLRFKPTQGANSATSFTVAVKLQGAIEKSNINLQNDEDLDKLIQAIKR